MKKKYLNLNILSYNCHGLENKVLYNDFFQYVRSSDVFMILETHIMADKVERFKRFFNGFDTYCIPAIKNNRFGRGIAGYVYGVKKDLREKKISYEFKKIENIELILIKCADKSINVMPLYLRTATCNEDLELVKNVLINKDLENLIIGNYIGNLQQSLDEFIKSTFKSGFDTRKSRDSVVNSKGNMFMEFCQDFGLHILNGCTIGDELGNFTFVSGVSESVNHI